MDADTIGPEPTTQSNTDGDTDHTTSAVRAGEPTNPEGTSGDRTRMDRLANAWNRIRYSLYAPVYRLLARPLAPARQRAIDRLGLQPGDRILILGSGPGVDLEYLPPGVDVTAIDLTPAMIRRTEARATAFGREVDARVGDAQSLPFEADSFDAVLLHLILSVVPNPGAVAAETTRVLAPGGRVSIVDKFVPAHEAPSMLRRMLNPPAIVLFSSLTRSIKPILASTDLTLGPRESYLMGLYTVTIARSPDDG